MSSPRSRGYTWRTRKRMLESPSKATLARLPKIVEGLLAGKSYREIAGDLGVSERTIRRDRQHGEFQSVLSRMFDQLISELAQLSLSEDPQDRRLYIKEKGKLVRSMLPRRFEQKLEISLKREYEAAVKFIVAETGQDGLRRFVGILERNR